MDLMIMAESGNTELIIRVLGRDIDGTKPLEHALRKIKGIDHRYAGIAVTKFRAETKSPASKKAGEMTKEEVQKLEDILVNPTKYGLPAWAMNRRNDIETGENQHKTMNDLDFSLRNDNQRLAEIKSYRGIRKMWGLTVRGQKTRSTHRGKGGSVSVVKKTVVKGGAKK
jgi:ribosomal protein S13